jgi:3-deoxy-D-manno-octulosonic-acid transferase
MLGLRLYQAMTWALRPLAVRKMKQRVKTGKEDPTRVSERFGIASADRPDGKLIWFHAVGVGEVLTIPSLIKGMLAHDPNLNFLITSTVRNSAVALAANMPPRTQHQFIPLDATAYITPFLDHWAPDLSVWMEQEIFPNFIDKISKRDIPLALLNGRMDSTSADKKMRAKKTFSSVYNKFRFIHVQNETSLNNFLRFDVNSEILSIVPTLKAGADPLADWPHQRANWDKQLIERNPWCASSLHLEEADIVLSAQSEIIKSQPNRILILVPRNPDEGVVFQKKANDRSLKAHAITSHDIMPSDTQILIADTMGQLGLWYRICSTAFIGGSLCDVNGHNPFEAISLDCAVIHGPNYANFGDSYDDLLSINASIQINSAKDLTLAVQSNGHSAKAALAKSLVLEGKKNLTKTAVALCKMVTLK